MTTARRRTATTTTAVVDCPLHFCSIFLFSNLYSSAIFSLSLYPEERLVLLLVFVQQHEVSSLRLWVICGLPVKITCFAPKT